MSPTVVERWRVPSVTTPKKTNRSPSKKEKKSARVSTLKLVPRRWGGAGFGPRRGRGILNYEKGYEKKLKTDLLVRPKIREILKNACTD